MIKLVRRKIRPGFFLWGDWKIRTILIVIILLLPNLAFAQVMPPPHNAPRTPVNRQALPDNGKTALPQSREVSGPATVIDGEHIRINDIDLRLFGVVPPQLSASFGPQARAALDELTKGQNVDCHVRDRDHDGRFLATCATAVTKADLALELLKRGLAVTARGSVQPTDLAAPYEAAELAAQTQKIGLWSVLPPPPVTVVATPQPAAPANSNVPPLPSELKKPPAAPEKPSVTVISPPSAAASIASAPNAEQAQKTQPAAYIPTRTSSEDESRNGPGFFARYQMLITGLVMLAVALVIMIVLAAERRSDRREEIKAIAAALRGELLAARAVCQARLRVWDEDEDKNPAWPRIRATLYQAYVGRIGWLGAGLARQVASIYGQASDYAAYFGPNGGSASEPHAAEAASKHRALQTLVQYIEEVLPKLAIIERTGVLPKNKTAGNPAFALPPGAPPPHGTAETTHSDPMSYPAPRTKPPIVSLSAAPLWNIVKKFTSLRQPESRTVTEEPLPDYTTLIEEEIARMSSEEESAGSVSNVTKFRTGA